MKRIFLAATLILLLALTACSAASGRASRASAAQADSPGELSTAQKLLLGSFKLEDTDQAITPEQAAELLPLWYVYKDISISDTAAQEELDALVNQIQDTMSSDQVDAIQAMNLGRRDIMTLMQEQGISSAAGSAGMQTGAGTGGFPGGGGFPDGGPPAGMPPGGGEFGGNPADAQTGTGSSVAPAGFGTVDTSGLVDALLELLTRRTQAQ